MAWPRIDEDVHAEDSDGNYIYSASELHTLAERHGIPVCYRKARCQHGKTRERSTALDGDAAYGLVGLARVARVAGERGGQFLGHGAERARRSYRGRRRSERRVAVGDLGLVGRVPLACRLPDAPMLEHRGTYSSACCSDRGGAAAATPEATRPLTT